MVLHSTEENSNDDTLQKVKKKFCFNFKSSHSNPISLFSLIVLNSTPFTDFSQVTEFDVVCNKGIYLSQANERGMISSNPLTQLLDSYDECGYAWLAKLIRLFVAISITVSYLAVGSAMYHALKGWANHLYERILQENDPQKPADNFPGESAVIGLIAPIFLTITNDTHRQRVLGITIFTFVGICAMCMPKGFTFIIKYVTSLSLNIISGPLLWLMIQYRNTKSLTIIEETAIFSFVGTILSSFLYEYVYDASRPTACNQKKLNLDFLYDLLF